MLAVIVLSALFCEVPPPRLPAPRDACPFLKDEIFTKCGCDPVDVAVMTRLAESKFTIEEKELVKECLGAGGNANVGKRPVVGANVYGCLEETKKVNETIAKTLADLVTKAASDVRQRTAADWDQCHHDILIPDAGRTVRRPQTRPQRRADGGEATPGLAKCQSTKDEKICWSMAVKSRDAAGLPPYPVQLLPTVYGYNPRLRTVNALEILVYVLEELRKSGCNEKPSVQKMYVGLRKQNCDDLAFRLKQASGDLDLALNPSLLNGATSRKFGN